MLKRFGTDCIAGRDAIGSGGFSATPSVRHDVLAYPGSG